MTKTCPRCGEDKPRDQFRPLKNRVHPYCRPCEKGHALDRRKAKQAVPQE